MFGYGRRRSHGQLAKAELGQSYNHLKQAAVHAAGGVGASVGPRVRNARGYVTPTAAQVRKTAATGLLSTTAALGPLAVAATSGAKQAGSMARNVKAKKVAAKRKETRSGRRWPLMLAVGAAAGAVAAKAIRRRREREWEAYDPNLALEMARSGEMPPSAAQTAPGVAQASLAAEQQSAMGRSSSPVDKAKSTATPAGERLDSAAESAKQTAKRTVDKTESAALGNTSTPSRNHRA